MIFYCEVLYFFKVFKIERVQNRSFAIAVAAMNRPAFLDGFSKLFLVLLYLSRNMCRFAFKR